MQTVFFDVDGVLIDGYHFRPEYRKCWHKNLKADFGIDPDYFSKTFFVDPFSNKVLKGDMDLKAALCEWLPSVGCLENPQKFMDYWLLNDSSLNLDLIEKIKLLKESGSVRLFIATNQAHNRAKHLMETLGLNNYFEDIFYSAKMGVLKPNRDYFEYISDYLELSKDEHPIIFDDTPEVLNTARLCGWMAYEYINVRSLEQSPFITNILQKSGR